MNFCKAGRGTELGFCASLHLSYVSIFGRVYGATQFNVQATGVVPVRQEGTVRWLGFSVLCFGDIFR